MARAALSLPPTINCIQPLQDAYLDGGMLRTLLKTHRRYWTFGKSPNPSTVALPDNRYAKSIDGFRDHIKQNDPHAFYQMLSEYADIGVERPSSYADSFHQQFYSPRVRWSENAAFAECLVGGWQTCTTGMHFGEYRKYDITSAYLWAGSQGLPDTTTFKKCRKLEACTGDTHGLFRVTLRELPHSYLLPTPYNHATECIVTDHEINTYGLRVDRVLSGVVWNDTVRGDRIVSAVRAIGNCWKQVARSYWGRWAQTQHVVCHANGKTWTLGNPLLNAVWAHLIIGRVRERLWRVAKNAVHVYVDSVITKEVLPTGTEVGDWRLETTYPYGVVIMGPGQYGDISSKRLERMAGVAKDSVKRDRRFWNPYNNETETPLYKLLN